MKERVFLEKLGVDRRLWMHGLG